MDCVFCSIVAGEENTSILDETDTTIAFAPLDPISDGHLLVVPNDHYDSLFDVPESVLSDVMKHTKTIASRLRSHDFDGVNLLHASGRAGQQSVSHFHVHLCPRRSDDGLDLWPDSSYEHSDFDTYESVRTALGGGDSR